MAAALAQHTDGDESMAMGVHPHMISWSGIYDGWRANDLRHSDPLRNFAHVQPSPPCLACVPAAQAGADSTFSAVGGGHPSLFGQDQALSEGLKCPVILLSAKGKERGSRRGWVRSASQLVMCMVE